MSLMTGRFWRRRLMALVLVGLVIPLASGGQSMKDVKAVPAKDTLPAPDLGAIADPALEAAWLALFSEMTPLPNKEIKLSELLGPLPDQKACEQAGGLTPDQFLAVYRAANEDDRQVMKRFLLARFHELARRGVISYPGLMALVGPERAGVNGSRRFGVAPIPLGSYNALLNYLESVALMIGGPDYVPSDASRERLDRALQASLAISSNEVRLQYRDFDVVWSNVLRDLTCAEQAGKPSRPPGIFWLYAQVRESAGLAWMPTLPAGLAERVEDEGGALFARAREETRVMPESLAAVTAWKCDEISQ